ncbi:ATP-binding protein [Rhodocytophaga aerolata]|uniref:ATP-binding protein n=2 Tax=Rhodocytophaga aerolata TaxID=455078 RepID=A0ABT8QXR3_9BACT|nr:ATP-binding protein [Rhodocytophaga aerolata]MDO1444622.1 ATP-binding protein [Rhodocytophaga aerolata]
MSCAELSLGQATLKPAFHQGKHLLFCFYLCHLFNSFSAKLLWLLTLNQGYFRRWIQSYIASALSHQACMQGYKVMYFNIGKLFSRLKMSKADASYSKEINKIEK